MSRRDYIDIEFIFLLVLAFGSFATGCKGRKNYGDSDTDSAKGTGLATSAASTNSDLNRVAQFAEIPVCNTTMTGEIFYVETDMTFHYCNGSFFVELDLRGNPGADAIHWLVTTTNAPTTQCPTGGIQVIIGPDVNGDAVLATNEFLSTEFICNGVNGTPWSQGDSGQTGVPGADGINGQDGTSCSVSDNGDNSATIACDDGTSVIITNGQDGVDGQDGQNGVAGQDGVDGLDGADGTSCFVTDNGDNTATIACDDGTSVTIEKGLDGSSCAVTDNGDNTATIACDDGTSVTIEKGLDGSSCSVSDNGNGTSTVSCDDGTIAVVDGGHPALLIASSNAISPLECPEGGEITMVGYDENNNGILEAAEVVSSETHCYPFSCGNRIVASDADVQALATEGCTRIDGYLTIRGSVTSLAALSSIQEVTLGLTVENTQYLANLLGLESIYRVGKRSGIGVTIRNNSMLTSLEGLESLKSNLRDLIIENNSALTSLTGLESLESNGTLKIISNGALTNLDSLESLASCRAIYVENNGALTNLDGLESLVSCESIHVDNNDALVSLSGLNHIPNRLSELTVNNNDALSTLAGLENITHINSQLQIKDNNSLLTLGGLEGIAAVAGHLTITDNVNLPQCMADQFFAGITFSGYDDGWGNIATPVFAPNGDTDPVLCNTP